MAAQDDVEASDLAALLGPLAFLFMVSISVAAAIYRLPMIPGPLVHRIGLRSVSDLPGSKDLVTAGAWASLIAAVPVLSLGASPGWATLAIFLLTFTLMFSRSVVMDLRDIRGDRMVGKETLPIVLGRETTKRVLLALIALTGVLLLAAVHFGLVPVADYVLLLPLLVITGALFLYHKKWVHRGSVFEVVVD